MRFNCRLTAAVITALGIMQLIHQVTSSDSRKSLYYGWFFDGETAKSLENITTTYLQQSLNSSEFTSFLDSALLNSSMEDPLAYFKKPLDPNTQEHDPSYHVTSMFCGACGTSSYECSSYSDTVANYVGKAFKMELIGLFFTNKTYGLRVKLSPEQEDLFNNEIERNITNSEHDFKSSSKRSTAFAYPGIELVEQEENLKPSLSSAHVTVGCAPNISAVQTGYDLFNIVDMESDTEMSKSRIQLGEDLMIHYGDWNAFVIYPKYKMIADATFNPYYCPGKANLNAPLGIFISVLVVLVWHL